jgi:hypothetical protein
MDIAVRRPITARNRRHSAEILADNQSKSSFAACFRARLTILTTRENDTRQVSAESISG